MLPLPFYVAEVVDRQRRAELEQRIRWHNALREQLRLPRRSRPSLRTRPDAVEQQDVASCQPG